MLVIGTVFFFNRITADELRIRVWISDVVSSDREKPAGGTRRDLSFVCSLHYPSTSIPIAPASSTSCGTPCHSGSALVVVLVGAPLPDAGVVGDRTSVGEGKRGSGVVVIGGSSDIKVQTILLQWKLK